MKLLKTLLDPRIALLIFLIYCIAYFVFLDEEGGFTSNFLNFGPSIDPANPTKFMGININTWSKTLMVYSISFITALLTGYYEVSSNNFMEKLVDPQLTSPFGLTLSTIITSFDKIIGLMLQIISILLISTQQLQFMLPELVADILVGIFDTYFLFDQKKLSS